jgi:hypothetical protein
MLVGMFASASVRLLPNCRQSRVIGVQTGTRPRCELKGSSAAGDVTGNVIVVGANSLALVLYQIGRQKPQPAQALTQEL